MTESATSNSTNVFETANGQAQCEWSFAAIPGSKQAVSELIGTARTGLMQFKQSNETRFSFSSNADEMQPTLEQFLGQIQYSDSLAGADELSTDVNNFDMILVDDSESKEQFSKLNRPLTPDESVDLFGKLQSSESKHFRSMARMTH
jgi:hypothetical protein